MPAPGKAGVCIVFGSHVIAGTRARKSRTKSYNAFTSLNFPDLASIHESRVVRYIPWEDQGDPVFYHRLNTRVFLLKLTPGMDPAAFAAAGELCDGLIIESYGVGGIPEVYLEELDKLISQGKTVIMATQVPQEGSDLSVYQVGKHVKDRYHLLESYDMTLEATVVKLMWAMGQSDDPESIRKLFCTTSITTCCFKPSPRKEPHYETDCTTSFGLSPAVHRLHRPRRGGQLFRPVPGGKLPGLPRGKLFHRRRERL